MAINLDSHRFYGVLDVMTDGPHGSVFAIGVVIYKGEGEIVDEYFARMPSSVVRNNTVRELVLPALSGEMPTHDTYRAMLDHFARWYIGHSQHTTWLGSAASYLAHATLFHDASKHGVLTPISHPRHVIDVYSMLLAVGDPSLSVEEYAERHRLPIATRIIHPLHPIRCCVVTAAVFFDVLRRHGVTINPVAEGMVMSSGHHQRGSDESTPIVIGDGDGVGRLPVDTTPTVYEVQVKREPIEEPVAAPNEPTEGFDPMPPPPPRPVSAVAEARAASASTSVEAFDEDDDVDDKIREWGAAAPRCLRD
jgi:hypothetical protein